MKTRFLSANGSRRRRLVLSLLPALLIALIPFLLTPLTQAGGPRYVAPGGNCGGPAPCYASIQDAVDAAASGDEIRVANGTYSGIRVRGSISEVLYISKTVMIQGGYTTGNWTTPDPSANPTTLDAQAHGVVIVIEGKISPSVAGLHITGGYADWAHGVNTDSGGGVRIISATATLSNNRIDGNKAVNGAGIFLVYSDALLTANQIMSNTGEPSGDRGAGVYIAYSAATLRNNVIQGNSASTGGGLYLVNSPCTLSGNLIAENNAIGTSAGVHLASSAATLNGNIVISNVAGAGGGLGLYDSPAVLTGNTIIFNRADSWDGGGILANNSNISLVGNTIAYNQSFAHEGGGGIYLCCSDATLRDNVITYNYAIGGGGAALNYYGHYTLTGNRILSNSASFGGGLEVFNSTANLSGNRIVSNVAGSGGGLSAGLSHITLTNEIVSDNTATEGGGAAVIWGYETNILHTTFARNLSGDGSALIIQTPTHLTNTIFTSHTVAISVTAGATATLDGVLWFANSTNVGGPGANLVNHEVMGHPAFAADGYHLLAGSPAIDQGVAAGVSDDIDGQPRPHGAAPDLGADEYYLLDHNAYLPLIAR